MARLHGDLNGQRVSASIGRAVVVIHDEIPAYDGSYVVTPSHAAQVLETKDKRMLDDVIVNWIPYWEVPNEHGVTVYIGGSEENG